ncbi:MAG: hypothetical protein JW769_02040 [Parachlamydiales bacterium]|nr:hypothetical protein [Parachlamydiales bacterium]
MKNFFLMWVGFLMVLMPICGSFALSKQEQIEHIDRQITVLQQEKRGLEGRIEFYESEANRLQFQNTELSSAKKYWQLAQSSKALVQEINQKIEDLQKEKISLAQTP